MAPVWIALVFLALLSFYVGQDAPRKQAVNVAVMADVAATNFLAYRGAVARYLADNPGATGTIDDALLAPYWPPGYIRRPEWTNVVAGGSLYVFSAGVPSSGAAASVAAKTPGSLLVGTKNATTGRLQSVSGIDTGINLPPVIAAGALVMMGR